MRPVRSPGAYLHELQSELTQASIPRGLRGRIVSEFADHLASDARVDIGGDPAELLGEPRALARQFADELGTGLALKAATRAFAALAVAGCMFVLGLGVARLDSPVARLTIPSVPVLAVLVCVLAAQVSFVAGGLGLLRAVRLRRAAVISGADAAALVRRAGVGLAAGATTVGAPIVALATGAHLYAGATPMFAAFAIGLVAIGVATPRVVAASRLRPCASGEGGDLYSDLRLVAPVPAGRRCTWAFALAVAGALAVAVTLLGIAADDPYDGALRGVAEAIACLGGFGVLGRYLSLRH